MQQTIKSIKKGAGIKRKAILDLTPDQNEIGEDAGKHLPRVILTSCGNGDCGISSSGDVPSTLLHHKPLTRRK